MRILTPAYGRDYRSKAAVVADFEKNLDFVESQSGRYINKEQLAKGEVFLFRYAKLRKTALHYA